MKGTRIVWPEAGRADVEEFVVPEPGAREVLVGTEYSVLSAGTEKACLLAMPNTSCRFPQYPGYSATGRVLAAGSEVDGFAVGDRVVAYHSPHASHTVKNISDLVKIYDDTIPGEEAAFIIIAAMSLHGVRKVSVELGESVLVIGLGLLGLFATQLAAASGALPVIALDLSAKRRLLAEKLGADHVLDPSDKDFQEKFKRICGGKGANAVIEVTGVPAAMNLALECVARAGRISALGCTRHKVDGVDFYRDIHRPGVSIIGAHNMVRPLHDTSPGHWTMRDDMRVLLNMLRAGRLKVAPLISRMVSPGLAGEVYKELLENNDAPLGIVFNWKQ